MTTFSTQSSLLFRLRTREDSVAWTRFVRLYTPLVRHWIAKLDIEIHHSEDLLQDIFVSLLSQVSFLAHRPPNSFRGWLHTVTLNRCRDYFRRLDRKSYAHTLQSIEVAMDDPQDQRVQSEYHRYLAHTALQLMKDCFSESTWQACWQSVVEQRSAEEISQRLGISPNAVYLARARVLKRLREELDGLWD